MLNKIFIICSVFLSFFISNAYAQEKGFLTYGAHFEQFEYRLNADSNDGDVLAWDGDLFIGDDDFRLLWQTEGEYSEKHSEFETLENQFLYSTPISDFFDGKLGVRYDSPEGKNRAFLVAGVQGLAPQFIEVDIDLFLSEKGDVSARLDVDYEFLLTNYLTLTPTAEIDIAFSDDTDVGVASGIVSSEIGLRLSYDVIDRSVSPYIGVFHERLYGDTAALSDDRDSFFFVVGSSFIF